MRAAFEAMVRDSAGFTLLGSAATLADARAALMAAAPDVAIVDLGLPDGDGAELIAMLRERAPGTLVLVSTVFGDEAHVIRAIQAGARGYLLKDTTADELVRSIAAVHEGGSPLSPQVARHLLKRLAPAARASQATAASAPDVDALTAREIDILTRISQGYTVAETAELLAISYHTVTTHIKNIYSKLAVHNRVEAVNTARRKGLIL
ncbi:DNA-binding response regulator, NarL/FixJ family, contains REC and HTH domains [Chitinasiproducens palmae]|uniref:DNA-binding response regulator, NarL/FixJ family, contains REC and HTH domains n=2 Tax=Chitinasiproducens palmae TaxID=1770053 RepID=A0A1H2PJR0_9BURK|nr:DNA-binding response regulator, NarL/FixJ family, contains REC and HTH domains [Chitinasiproducens palmae]